MSKAHDYIFSGEQHNLSNEDLLKYLQQKLDAETGHEVEKSMVDDPFTNDAIEGLQQMQDRENIPEIVSGLNRKLQNSLKENKKPRRSGAIDIKPAVIAIIIILLMAAIAWLVIHRLGNS